MRFQLFEFEDLPWFPDLLRAGMTDYLRFVLGLMDYYEPAAVLIQDLMQRHGRNVIVDLASGGGGAIEGVAASLKKSGMNDLKIFLTDRFPNVEAYSYIQKKTNGEITGITTPVDATKVPPNLHGVRTIFSAAHHFTPDQLQRMLKDAVAQNAPVGIFDGGDKHLLTAAGMLVVHPLAFLFATPFFRPVRLSSLLFTYLVPLIPLCTIWDGLVSLARLYTPGELLKLAKAVEPDSYLWRSGKLKNKVGMHVTYLVGYPVAR